MFNKIYHCAVLALFPFFAACNGDNTPGISIAGETGVVYSQSAQPQYYKAALARAAQLSTSPNTLVAMCDKDAKTKGNADNALANYVYQCVENAGME